MSIKLPNEQRILELERTVARLASELAALRVAHAPSSPDQIIRPVKTIDPSSGLYPTTGNASPIVFLDAINEGLGETTDKTDRSASQQNYAATVDETLVPVDTTGIAFRYNRQWLFIPGAASPSLFLFQAPSGGIPARDEVTPGAALCSKFVYSSDYDELQQTLTAVDVKNFATSIVCSNGDRLGIAMQIGGYNWVVAEDCGDSGETEFPFASE